jgi:hypothetical protein
MTLELSIDCPKMVLSITQAIVPGFQSLSSPTFSTARKAS